MYTIHKSVACGEGGLEQPMEMLGGEPEAAESLDTLGVPLQAWGHGHLYHSEWGAVTSL